MSAEDIEAEALKLDPKSRARLAERLLESLDNLSEAESVRLWAEEAERRNHEWDVKEGRSSSAEKVLRNARSKLK